MALNPKFSDTCVNAEANAIGDALDSGYIRIYDGSQPANADTAVGAQNHAWEATGSIPVAVTRRKGGPPLGAAKVIGKGVGRRRRVTATASLVQPAASWAAPLSVNDDELVLLLLEAA